MDKKTVKELAVSLGTDLVGIAAADRFVDCPKGHSPVDKFPSCKSVVVLGCTFPRETLALDTVSYTAVRNTMVGKLDSMAERMASELKKHKVKAKAIKSARGRLVDGGVLRHHIAQACGGIRGAGDYRAELSDMQ